MNAKTDPGYTQDPYPSKFLADAEGTQNKSATPFPDALSVHQLTAENAWTEDDAVAVFPEGHWYPVLLIVALMGVLVDFLFQVTR